MWVAALIVVVAAGVLGESGGGPSVGVAPSGSSAADAAVAANPSNPSSPDVGAVGDDLSGRILVLQQPPRDGAVVTTRDLVVRGLVAAGTGPVRVGLASANGKALAFETVEPPATRGSTARAFDVGLPLGNPRPGGTMVIQVIAYGADGVPIDVVRRQFVVGPVLRTVGGEDGIIGGIIRGD